MEDKYIMIRYNPEKIANDTDNFDLFTTVCDMFDEAGIRTAIKSIPTEKAKQFNLPDPYTDKSRMMPWVTPLNCPYP